MDRTFRCGLGGASYAYDPGNFAVMNNPATLGRRTHEKAKVGLGLTLLMPDVASRQATLRVNYNLTY